MIDNNIFNQKITNIQLEEFKGINKKADSAVDDLLIKNKKTIVPYIIAILLESKLVDNKEQARLERLYGFNQEDIMKEIASYFTNENESAISSE